MPLAALVFNPPQAKLVNFGELEINLLEYGKSQFSTLAAVVIWALVGFLVFFAAARLIFSIVKSCRKCRRRQDKHDEELTTRALSANIVAAF